jgi:ADP-heptose:LPS heptosyltransferase
MTHVLAARLDSLGDVLVTGPAIRALAASAGEVTVLAGPGGRAAAGLLPGVERVVTFACPWILADPAPVDPAAVHDLVEKVAALAVDEAVIFTSFHQSPLPLALLLRLAGVPRIAATSVDYPGSLLDVRHRIDDDVHEVQRSLDLVATLGYALAPGDDGALRLRGATSSAANWSPPAERYVVVHPGASVPARAWAPQRHAELVRALAGEGRHVVVTGEPAEVALTARVAGPPQRHVTDLGGRTSLGELAHVLAGAQAVVVGNTGPAHLAAAVGTPIVSTFAPTVPAVRWRPWGVPHELLFEDVPCAGCRARSCPVPGHPCLAGVSVEDVLAAIDRVAASERAVVAA